MTEPSSARSEPPSDLDARYVPFVPVSEWPGDGAELGLFDAAAAELDQLAELVGPERTSHAAEVAVRAAAYDTGAIEGLYATDRGVTFSVAEQTTEWEAVAAQESGRDALRHFRAQLAGFELVLDAVTGAVPISAAWLRALHETICGGQDTFRALTAVGWQEVALPKGEFKRWSNHVREAGGSWHSYAPAEQTPAEVQRLVDQIASTAFARAHPVVQAAYAHHAFVSIHPFADGNGRVARALASVFLYRAARVPLHVWTDQRRRYLEALRAADTGDQLALIRFVRDVAIDTIRLVVLRLRPAARRAVPAPSRRRNLISMPITVESDDVLLARRVLTAVADHARQRAAPDIAIVNTAHTWQASQLPAGFESWPGPSGPGSVEVAVGGSTSTVTVARATAAGSSYPLALVATGMPPLPLRRDQLDPAITEVTAAQLAAWVEDLLDVLS